GARPAHGQMIEGVAAIVNDDVITTRDVTQRMGLILASTGLQPTEEILVSIQAQALASLINERLQLQKAAEFEIEVSDAEVTGAVADLARQNNASPDSFAADLANAGIDIHTLEEQLRAEIAWNVLVSGLYRSRIRVSDDQISQTLERLAANAAKPQYLISEILIEIPLTASEEQVMVAVQTIVGQLQAGAPFPAVARQFSAAPSAAQGGDVGWVRSGEMTADIERVVSQLRPGQLSPPIETADGIYLIALREVRRGSDPERLILKQILVPLGSEAGEGARQEARDQLRRARRAVRSCDNVERAAERADGALVADIGTVAPSDLAPAFREAVADLEPGDASEPLDVPTGVLSLVMCNRTIAIDAGLPTREQVENRLMDEQLSLAARRFLRDLRRDATIETRAR
ncbi:MAG: peptidylprolyl isomerase, partial [Caulobacterales bacterium]|nr:peptidylprolyl isomerase [Caulobacterales bacterium]